MNALGEAWADLGAGFEAGADNDALRYSLRSLTDNALLDRAARLAARQMAEPAGPPTSGRGTVPLSTPACAKPPPADHRGGRKPSRRRVQQSPMASAPRPKRCAHFRGRHAALSAQAVAACRATREHRGCGEPRTARRAGGQAAGPSARQRRQLRALPAVPEVEPQSHRASRPFPGSPRPSHVLISQPGTAPRPRLSGPAGGQPHPGRRRLRFALTEECAKARPELQRLQLLCRRPARWRLHHRPKTRPGPPRR